MSLSLIHISGVCGTKAECEDLKAAIAEFLSTELKLTLSEEKTLITHSSEKVRFLGYDICVRRNKAVSYTHLLGGRGKNAKDISENLGRETIDSCLLYTSRCV